MKAIRTAPGSLGQRLLGFMEHYRGAESPLAVPVFYRLRGELDRAALESAVNGLVARHEALRTTYQLERRGLTQTVHAPEPVELERHAVGDDPEALSEAMRARARAPFDLTVSPVRVALFDIAPDDAVLMVNIHHLSTDGWSGGVLTGDLGRLYRPGGRAPSLPAPAWQYLDFCEWQRTRSESGKLAGQQDFWRSRLAGAQPPGLPPGRDDEPQQPATHLFDLGQQATAALHQLCRSQRASTFVVGLAAFAAVLCARTGDTDFAVSSMFANRSRPELAETVGFLTTLLVLRLTLPTRPSFLDVLAAARDVVFDALDNQEVPYHVVPKKPGERGPGLENILFQVMAGPEYRLRLDGLDVAQIGPPSGAGSRFDLEFALIPGPDAVQGIVWHDRRRFDTDRVRELAAEFEAVLVRAAADPTHVVSERASV
ncbi:condensation domain-containing protein [Kutzneria sp. NPDC052558]|uniref:condensation domain-containing protein n=1 Tax=Kutzneria sp. NPDC052558 TaxID=3364121 RepID=UPI0037C6A114